MSMPSRDRLLLISFILSIISMLEVSIFFDLQDRITRGRRIGYWMGGE
jgi:hypothetical protein